jgi:hypothetical protein
MLEAERLAAKTRGWGSGFGAQVLATAHLVSDQLQNFPPFHFLPMERICGTGSQKPNLCQQNLEGPFGIGIGIGKGKGKGAACWPEAGGAWCAALRCAVPDPTMPTPTSPARHRSCQYKRALAGQVLQYLSDADHLIASRVSIVFLLSFLSSLYLLLCL